MDKTRIYLAIALCIFINVIIKACVIWIANVVKSYFNKEDSERILTLFNLFVFPILNIIFIVVMPRIYPVFFFEEHQVFINSLIYGALILSIYLWFFKPLVRLGKNLIKNYQLKNGGQDG